jgi:tetratricopeptide (TPR) repeat protein
MSEDEWAGAIENLAEARLIEYLGPDDPLNCHPLVREHFAESFRDSDGVGFREAHLRLYQHYAKKAPYRPNNLTEMDPLFYAVYHGCQAQRHTEVRNLVYRSRILRDDDFYLTRSLGAYGADLSLIAAFFTTPWTCVSDQLTLPLQGWILQRAGFLLHMNGRLSESIVPMGASVDIMERTLDRANQALFIGNLADLHLGLGQIEQAITLARRSVRLADNAHVLREQMVNRTVLADALHKAGKLQEAARQFGVAEEIQANYEKEFPALYSLAGYRYCEFLLSLGHEHEVAIRAKRALDWYGGNAPARDVAQDHLSLSRTCVPGSVEAASHLEVAIRELRLSGQRSLLPLGLLTRAAHHRQVRDFERAQRDLDEARIVATRCEMRLHLTDYHLEQARLFLVQSRDNEARCHYVAAKRLVEETGYHRRDIDLVSLGAKLAE